MTSKVPYYERTFRGKFKISIIFFVLLAVITISLWVITFRAIKVNKIVAYNKIVEAVVTDYYMIGGDHTAYPTFGFDYCYVDENGITYKGSTGRTFVYGYEAAEKAIEDGLTIRIYVDNKGNSVPVGTEMSQKKFITILVFSIIFVVGDVIFFIIFLIPKKSKENKT
ncbi:MAG: hypothetical protein K2I30_06275 [Clostridia bacterium]|nr:hypothetical protein [Clostridia bacterium]